MMASSSSEKKVSTAARFSEIGSARKRVADSVALVMASSGEAIVGGKVQPRKGCGESALPKAPGDKKEVVWMSKKEVGNYS